MSPTDPPGPMGGEPTDGPRDAAHDPLLDATRETGGATADPVTRERTIDLTDRTIDLTDRTVDVTDRALGRDGSPPADPEDAASTAPAGTPGDDSVERQRALGARLRRIRAQQGMSLAQVEQRSEGRWKAVVVGAYERGDRAVTVERLAALAAFYDVPVSHLLPPAAPTSEDEKAAGVLLDLTRLAVHDERPDALGAVARFARRMQLQRGDHAGRVITLRDSDLRTIALAAGTEPADLRQDLLAAGVCER